MAATVVATLVTPWRIKRSSRGGLLAKAKNSSSAWPTDRGLWQEQQHAPGVKGSWAGAVKLEKGQAGEQCLIYFAFVWPNSSGATWLMMMTLSNRMTAGQPRRWADWQTEGLTNWRSALTDKVGDVTQAFLWPHKSRIAVLGFSLASHTLIPTVPCRSLCVHCARMCVGACMCVRMNWISK